ncbi:Sec-independent protein translocase subunit TatA [Glycomyces albidus]|jgi:sec-independent protein translocase protein TatA|uniref:Sec-independent protein translocase protein TatA n=1 Tax=Glycomyces albidus TaxID=2656774 RepID=A0A6L5GDK2_9ACTN|nr:Sec-independent protein translocase subunit TatA [Glycomyces albidus]MQM27718.1 twin-arginine translocase TatA/TatE family subunit [Glycomyces albidus]
MGALKPWHIIILVVVILLVFGSRKLPDMARGLGRSMRILKSETEAMKKDSSNPDDDGDVRAEPKHTREPLDPPAPVNETVIDSESVDRKHTR